MKSYKQFIKESKVLSKTDKDFIHSKLYHKIIFHGISNNYTINPDGSIDVDDNVSFDPSRSSSTKLRYKPSKKNKLTELPIKFNKVGGNFYCNDNELTTLEGAPKEVGGDFDCHNNQLTSLVGCPEVIGGDINCRFNKITDFKGVSEFFEGLFYCEGNPIEEIYTLFLQEDSINDSKCIKWINEFDVIQGNKVIMDRLEEVFHQLGMDIPQSVVNIGLKNLTFKNYEII